MNVSYKYYKYHLLKWVAGIELFFLLGILGNIPIFPSNKIPFISGILSRLTTKSDTQIHQIGGDPTNAVELSSMASGHSTETTAKLHHLKYVIFGWN